MNNNISSIVNALSIAGFDTSAGAGTLADVKTMSSLGVYACAVLTAVTAQNTNGVYGIEYMPKGFIAKQIDTIFNDIKIKAVKIGMLGKSDIVIEVGESLLKWKPSHIILDTVMISKHGNYLLEHESTETLIEYLIPMATIITPNLPEAASIIKERPAENITEMRQTVKKLHNKMTIKSSDTNKWVILKGGHLPGNEMVDIIFDGINMTEIFGNKIITNNTHGTGCTLSAALTALLAKGESVLNASIHAKEFLTKSIEESNRLNIGNGYGPLHHFYKYY
ncbi:phosphomethylpyrimidine kinase [Candidatus Kinetoplastibacterium desouzaii TCC079E]|uniref:hydroxymethylpyrimidine kinase n=1 Tax=Candidatus Kinetoplastidibacterium desouzai TCC079E TaxID=1208919 RepID=M1L1H4_9PROT|nr:bifunctional hydroxymethylpyrimidine kinase/phosphomethylpyrimidine kinase [Candidatus Kinetoplastibacterium desouzaii]AGF46623.1 phosphomethylpyrimidine kinase [Candidatus Kinetoplastibacterium desouzaii TCC079E]